jgi:aspartate dehydrogenase
MVGKKLLKIGIVGCGAIGSSLAKAIVSDFSDKAQLSSLYDIDMPKVYNLANNLGKKKISASSLQDLINNVDLVIEATASVASFDIAFKALSAGRSIMIMSVGGILEHLKELEIIAQEKNAEIFIPSGAICGIDGLKALGFGKINRVTLISRKHPRAFKGNTYILKKKINLDQIKEDTVLFEGNANDAVDLFPQNINVAATLSLAGLGALNTKVRIIASPALERNIHEVEIDSESGKIFTRTENVTHPDNPKTSFLAVLSAIATLKQILEPVKIGT